MVTMSAIWDRTAEVLRGRGSMLAGIAALLLFLPAVVQDAVSTYAGRVSGGAAIGGLIGLAAGGMAIWGNLALVAAASDPLVDRPAAFAIGGRRLPLAIGLSVLILAAFLLASVPAIVLLARSGLNPAEMALGGSVAVTAISSPGLMLAAALYILALAVAIVWIGARLSLFWPVLVNERRGIGTFARSFELTRGLTWRIVGVSILFVILLVVALSAAQLVTSLVARLLLGADDVATARFVGAVAGGIVSAGGAVVSATFVAQLYRVVSGREAAHAFA